MILAPLILKNIAHPFIACAYLKKDYRQGIGEEGLDVLVIEPHAGVDQMLAEKRKDTYEEFLIDCDLIVERLEKNGLHVDRIDIKTRH